MSPLTGVLDEAWRLYRRYAAHFLMIAFVIYLVTAIVVGLLRLAGPVGFILGGIAQLFAAFLVQAALIKAVQDVRDGRVDLDLSQTVSAALPYLLPVAAASILAAIGITIGLALIIVPGLILITFWAVIVPCIVIGGTSPIASFGESWRTVRGYAWHVFGTLVLVFLILIAFYFVLTLILLFLPSFLASFVSSVVAGTLVAPFQALVVALIYYRLTAAHANQPYVSTVPAGTTPEPPYPTTPYPTTPGPVTPSDEQAPPAPPTDPTPPTAPGATPPSSSPPWPTAPEPTGPDPAAPPPPTQPGPATPPDTGPSAPPPSGTP
jgi:hypothetical protein